jgi:hypothetical protein
MIYLLAMGTAQGTFGDTKTEKPKQCMNVDLPSIK